METDNENYDVSETAIKDHSMLGAHGEELCNNLDVHWMTQTCDSPKDETGKCVSVCVCVTVCVPFYELLSFSENAFATGDFYVWRRVWGSPVWDS